LGRAGHRDVVPESPARRGGLISADDYRAFVFGNIVDLGRPERNFFADTS
jgi:hypothetical protein